MKNTITIEGLAGYCTEVAAWQLLADLTEGLTAERVGTMTLGGLVPQRVEVANRRFRLLSEEGATCLTTFDAPEMSDTTTMQTAASVTWSLGALTFYLIMGCEVMNGQGGRAQQPTSKLPYMRPAMPELSELVLHCLAYHPAERPALGEIHELAVRQLEVCQDLIRRGPSLRAVTAQDASQAVASHTFWPEEMIPNND